MGIAQITRIITQIVSLLLAGLALAEAIEKVAEKLDISKADVRRVWRASGAKVDEVLASTKAALLPTLVGRALTKLFSH